MIRCIVNSDSLVYAQNRADATHVAYLVTCMGHVMPLLGDNQKLAEEHLGGIALVVRPARRRK